MNSENGKHSLPVWIKMVGGILGILVILGTGIVSSFSYYHRVKTESVALKELTTFAKNTSAIANGCKQELRTHIRIADKNFQLVDKDIESLQKSDGDLKDVQKAQTNAIGEQTNAITKLTEQTKNMKEAILRLEAVK